MRYSRVITSLVDESVAASLGGYKVEDALGGKVSNGDLIRDMLVEAVCDERFKATVEPTRQWEDSAQEFLEEMAGKMMEIDNLDEEKARRIIEQMLANFFVKMMRHRRRNASPVRKSADGNKDGEGDGNGKGNGKKDPMGAMKEALEKLGEETEEEIEDENKNEDENEDEDEDEDEDENENEDENEDENEEQKKDSKKEYDKKEEDRHEPPLRKGHGADQEKRFELEFLRSIPRSLLKLARLIGRCDENSRENAGRFLTAAKSDIAGITVGDDLSNLLPTEIALLSSPSTQDIFFHKYAQKRLQVFASASSSDGGKKNHQDGPVIICLDTSSSMRGKPWVIASALTMAVTIIAKRRHRKVLVIKYSDDHELFEVKSLRSQRLSFLHFLGTALDGGNNEDSMFRWLFSEILPKMDSFTSADVLCVSDFGWMPVSPEVFDMIKENKESEMKFYGLDTSVKAFDDDMEFGSAEDFDQPGEIIDSMWIWDFEKNNCFEKRNKIKENEKVRQTKGKA